MLAAAYLAAALVAGATFASTPNAQMSDVLQNTYGMEQVDAQVTTREPYTGYCLVYPEDKEICEE